MGDSQFGLLVVDVDDYFEVHILPKIYSSHDIIRSQFHSQQREEKKKCNFETVKTMTKKY